MEVVNNSFGTAHSTEPDALEASAPSSGNCGSADSNTPPVLAAAINFESGVMQSMYFPGCSEAARLLARHRAARSWQL
jgi:hypothetical protein